MLEYIFNHFCKDPIYRAQTLKHKSKWSDNKIKEVQKKYIKENWGK